MREPMFRGYSKMELTTPTQWIDGYGVTKINYIDGTSSVYLLTPYGDYMVHEDSVGEYTGIHDKCNIEICEGDILESDRGGRYKVVFNKGCFKIQDVDYLNANMYLLGESSVDVLKIVSNVYEQDKN